MNIKVSIIIPAYNAGNYLEYAIASALSQTYSNFEIIVVNDGSNDNGLTESTAMAFGDSIRYYYKPNGGVASALNYGISKMRGDLFSWLSHDDIYTPDKIQRQVAAFVDSGQEAIVYSDFFVIDTEGARLYSHLLPTVPQGGMRCFLAESSSLHGCTLLIPRRYLEEEGGFDIKLKATQDYDLWFRLAARHPFLHLAKQLVGVRFHSEQATTNMQGLVALEQDSLYCRFLESLGSDEIEIYANTDVLGYYLRLYCRFRAGNLRNATAAVIKSCNKLIHASGNHWSDWVRFNCAVLVIAPLIRLRVLVRQFLFKSDAGWFRKLVIQYGRLILMKK